MKYTTKHIINQMMKSTINFKVLEKDEIFEVNGRVICEYKDCVYIYRRGSLSWFVGETYNILIDNIDIKCTQRTSDSLYILYAQTSDTRKHRFKYISRVDFSTNEIRRIYNSKRTINSIVYHDGKINAIFEDKLCVVVKNNKPSNDMMTIPIKFNYTEYMSIYITTELRKNILYLYSNYVLFIINLNTRKIEREFAVSIMCMKIINDVIWLAAGTRVFAHKFTDTERDFDCIQSITRIYKSLAPNMFFTDVQKIMQVGNSVYIKEGRHDLYELVLRYEEIHIISRENYERYDIEEAFGDYIYIEDVFGNTQRVYEVCEFTNLRKDFRSLDFRDQLHVIILIWIFKRLGVPFDIAEKIIKIVC